MCSGICDAPSSSSVAIQPVGKFHRSSPSRFSWRTIRSSPPCSTIEQTVVAKIGS